jgi:rieske iron-sulfur protein
MSESDRSATTSVECISAELATPMLSCSDPTRRTLLLAALATGAYMASSRSAAADEDQPGSDERPQKADVLVFSEGEHAGEVIKPEDLKLGGPPVQAWPKDPKTSVVRKGSRLNEVLVVRLDPAELDDETRSRAADGIVAYSAICSHAGKGQRTTTTCLNAFAIIPNLILGTAQKSCLDQRSGVLRRFR